MPIGLSGPGPYGVTRQQCGPSCNRACIAELWRGCRSGAMRPPSCALGARHRGSAVLDGSASPVETGGPAFEGQPPIGGPPPARDPRAAGGRRGRVQVNIWSGLTLGPPHSGHTCAMIDEHTLTLRQADQSRTDLCPDREPSRFNLRAARPAADAGVTYAGRCSWRRQMCGLWSPCRCRDDPRLAALPPRCRVTIFERKWDPS